MRRRGGFTFVEILMSMMIIAILAGIVIPKAGDLVKQAKAASIVADIRAIQDVAAGYYADSSAYPPTAAMGQVPPAFVPGLGPNFSFVKPDYSLQYNNWTIYQTINGHPSTRSIVGITVSTKDATLGELVMNKLSAYAKFQWGDNYTFITDGL